MTERQALGWCSMSATPARIPRHPGDMTVGVKYNNQSDRGAATLHYAHPTFPPLPGEEVCVVRRGGTKCADHDMVVAPHWAADAIEVLEAAGLVVRRGGLVDGGHPPPVPDGEARVVRHSSGSGALAGPGTAWGNYLHGCDADRARLAVARMGRPQPVARGEAFSATGRFVADDVEAKPSAGGTCLRCGGPAYVGLLTVECERFGGCKTLDERIGEPSVQRTTTPGSPEHVFIARHEHEDLGEAAHRDEIGVHPTYDGAVAIWRAKMREKLLKDES